MRHIGSGILSHIKKFIPYASSSPSIKPAPQRNGEYSQRPLELVLEKRDGGIVVKPYIYLDSPSQFTKSSRSSFSISDCCWWRFGSPCIIASFPKNWVNMSTAWQYPCPILLFSRSMNRSTSRLGRKPC